MVRAESEILLAALIVGCGALLRKFKPGAQSDDLESETVLKLSSSILGVGFLATVTVRMFFYWLSISHIFTPIEGGVTRLTMLLLAVISFCSSAIIVMKRENFNDRVLITFAQSAMWSAGFLILGVFLIQKW